MGFVEAVGVCFEKYATFSGRARRSEYWFFFLFGFLASIVTGIFDYAIFDGEVRPISGLLGLATFLPSLAVAVRRFHDIDVSGWWLLAPFGVFLIALLMIFDGPITAVIGLLATLGSTIWIFSWMSKKGTFGPNTYGPDPIERFVVPDTGRPLRRAA